MSVAIFLALIASLYRSGFVSKTPSFIRSLKQSNFVYPSWTAVVWSPQWLWLNSKSTISMEIQIPPHVDHDLFSIASLSIHALKPSPLIVPKTSFRSSCRCPKTKPMNSIATSPPHPWCGEDPPASNSARSGGSSKCNFRPAKGAGRSSAPCALPAAASQGRRH
jgi:hypothetical protein